MTIDADVTRLASVRAFVRVAAAGGRYTPIGSLPAV